MLCDDGRTTARPTTTTTTTVYGMVGVLFTFCAVCSEFFVQSTHHTELGNIIALDVKQHVTGGSSAGSDFCSSLCLFGASGCQYKQPRVANSMCASVGCMVRVVHEIRIRN